MYIITYKVCYLLSTEIYCVTVDQSHRWRGIAQFYLSYVNMYILGYFCLVMFSISAWWCSAFMFGDVQYFCIFFFQKKRSEVCSDTGANLLFKMKKGSRALDQDSDED